MLRSTAVQTAASLGGGTNVIVRIIYDGTEEVSSTDINSLTLTAGSVTVLPDSGVNFTLKLNDKLLTLNKGYRLQGFKIESRDPGGPSGTGANAAAITLNAEGTPLKDMVIDCTGITTSGAGGVGRGDKCVHVPPSVSGTVTLENVRITIPSNQDFVTGILHEGRGTLKVTNGSSVVAAGSGTAQGVVGIYGNTASGSVEVDGSTVSLSAITATGSNGNVFAVVLSGPIASGRVEGSSIQVREGASGRIAIGVCVNASGASGTVTVQGNTFTNAPRGNTSIAIYKQAGNLVPTPIIDNNTFDGFSTSPPAREKRYVTSGFSCP
ncbi:hypothetical protein NW840_09625 [Synechococcus sp. R5-13]|uniref:hypothetical protein n=1 Tax=Synechococcus sp. R5-13 TaxID=2291953 RepID=UPI0039C4CFF1